MTFKEQIKADNKAVFMNTLEFSEEHVINDRRIPCIVDSYELMTRAKKIRYKTKFYSDRIGIKELLIYVRAEDFGVLPSQGRNIIFDGKPHIVSDALDEGGIYCISLEVNKA